jgi:BASS family bile acid:Na+ symporter
MFLSVVKIVLIPVSAGLVVHWWQRHRVERVMTLFPALSVLIIVLIIASIIALSREKLAHVAGVIGIVVLLHNVLGMTLGYGLAWLFRLPVTARRTVAIEVGMQNSGLGVALATAHFNAVVALPSSLFSVMHNLTGSLAASVWRRRTP